MKNKIRKMLVMLFLVAAASVSVLSAAGMPVFDLESWIYSVMEYSQMIQDAKNVVQGIMNSEKQFETLYETISSGDLASLQRNRYKTKAILQNAADALNDTLDHAANLKSVSEGVEDYDVYWGRAETLSSYIDDFGDIADDVQESINDFQAEIASSAEDSLDSYEDSTDSMTSAVTSQSTSKQMAQMNQTIADLTSKLEIQQQQNLALQQQLLLLEEAKEKEAAAKAVQTIMSRQEKRAQWYEENRVEPPDTSNFEV